MNQSNWDLEWAMQIYKDRYGFGPMIEPGQIPDLFTWIQEETDEWENRPSKVYNEAYDESYGF
jgi:hypothetical protein